MIKIGISGWKYKGWKKTFYPEKLSAKNELDFASRIFSSIEIDGSFYRLLTPSDYLQWYNVTPENFIFSIKGSRFITHVKQLSHIEGPLINFFSSGPLALKEKLGPILWQLPPQMIFKPEKIESFLNLLPKTFKSASDLIGKKIQYNEKINQNTPIKHAIEVRNLSFLNPWFIEILRKYHIALVFADTAGKWPYMEDVTSDFVYIRLHGDSILYVSGYCDEILNFWSKRIKQWEQGNEPDNKLTLTNERIRHIKRDVYVYFDNDSKVRAPFDAINLIKKLHL
ncbi:MAG: DUF72 domain-containing protein [Bacteriovoracaceae bacterium]